MSNGNSPPGSPRPDGGWYGTLLCVVVFAVLALFPAVARAGGSVPPDLEAAIQLKVLSFDTALKARLTKETLVIGVLYGGDKASQADATAIANAFTVLADKKKQTVHGKKLSVVSIAIGSDLDKQAAGANVLYVSRNVSAEQLAAISKLAESRKLPTLCATRDYLGAGVAIAVVAKDDKPGLVVHAGNAKRIGMSLDSKLLRLAEVIR